MQLLVSSMMCVRSGWPPCRAECSCFLDELQSVSDGQPYRGGGLVLFQGLGYNPSPRKKEAALPSGLSLGRKRPRRAYGDKSPRALYMLRRTKRQRQKPAVRAKALPRRQCTASRFLRRVEAPPAFNARVRH